MSDSGERLATETAAQAKRRQLEALLRRKSGRPASVPRAAPSRRSSGPLSFQQRRLWFLAELSPRDPFYNLAVGVQLQAEPPEHGAGGGRGGRLDRTALERALGYLMQRHEALRTVFESRAGEPVQRVRARLPRQVFHLDVSRLPAARREATARDAARALALTPFDLTTGPLLRLLAIELSPSRTLLICVVHHIVFDGWSYDIFERELVAAYRAFAAGRPPDLAPLPVQLLDFSQWQHQQLTPDALDDLLRYWKPQLLGLEALQLPTDRPRHGASHRGASHFMTVPAELVASAEAYGKEHGATLFMVLLGVFQLLLARTTGQQDVAVGSPITNRDRDDFEQLIGLFANTIVLRTEVALAASFEDLLVEVRQMALAAYRHAQMPFEYLVQELSPARQEGANPLVQLGLALQPKVPLSTLSLPGLRAAPWPFEAALAKMDLEFHLLHSAAGLEGYLFYFSDLFDATTIDRCSRHFRRLLRTVLAAPRQPVGSLPWLSAAETQQVVSEWNDTAAELAPDELVHERILAQAARRPHAVAIEDGRQRLSWGELARRAEQLAARLRDHGVGPESLVALWMERSLELIWGQLGVLCAGGAFLPLDPAHPEARLLSLIADAAPALVLTRQPVPALRQAAAEGDEASRPLPPVLRLGPAGVEGATAPSARAAAPARARRPHADNLAYVIYTSGSTGQPKGAELSHRGLFNLVASHLFDYQVGERRTQIAAPGFDGTVFEIWPGLAAGTTVCLVAPAPRAAPELLPAWLLEQRIDVCSVPTPIAEAALRHPWPEGLALRTLHAAGDRLHRASVRDIGAELVNVYGPTETTTTATWCKVRPGEADPPIGRPMMNVRAQVVDARLQPVPIGVAGELVLGGPVALARGYRCMPQRTAERFVPDPSGTAPGSRLYRTGDLVRLLASGDVEFLGRIDYQVKIRGNRIEIGEVMAALGDLPGLQEWAVVDRVRSRGDKELVAYLVIEPGHECKPAELSAALHERLPGYMVPAAFVRLEVLPRNPNGKLDRRALPAPERADRAASHAHVAPRTRAERRMAEVWSSVLGLDDIGVLDTFFELGGHSLLASRLVAEVERCFDTQLALRDLFRAPTVSKLTALVARQDDAVRRERLPPLQPAPHERFDRFPLTAVQQAYLLGRGESFDLGNVSAHGYLEFEGKGWQPRRIEHVIRRLVARHDMLRAIFPGSDHQRVLPEVPDFELPVQDLRGLPAAEVERAIERWRDAMSHQVLPADRWPIFDVRVSLLDDDLVRLHLDGDGLIADAWSVGLLAREAIDLYGDPELELPGLQISFRDCLLAERQLYRSAAAERARAYWHQRLPDVPPAPELPLARSPESLPGKPRFEGRALRLDAATWSRLRQHAAEAGLTPSGVLLAAFAETLGMWSKSRRLTLNLTTFNRRPWHPQVGLLVGDFTTLTLLAVEGDGATFADRARALQERLWSDLAHNQVDGLEVMRDLARRGHVPQAGLMPVVFSSILGQDPGGTDTFSSGWQEKIVYRITQTPQVWLDHQVTEENGALNCNWDAVEDLFPPGLLDDVFGAYHRLLLDLAAGEAWSRWRPVQVPPAQLAQRARSNQTRAEISGDLLQDGFDRQVAAQPEAPAVLTPERTLSYGELDRLAWSLAQRLRQQRVEAETLVAVAMEKGWQQVVAVLGILRAGAAYLPIDPALPAQRIEHLLEQGEVRLLVTQPWLQAQLEELHTDAQLLAVGAEPAPADLDATPFDAAGRPDSLAYVIFTSGSTGVPKGVMIDHRGAVNTLRDVNARFQVGPRDRVLALSSLSFDLSVYDIFGVLDAGGAVVLPDAAESRQPGHWLDLAERHRVTVWNSVPALMELCVDAAADAGRQLPPSLRLVLMSGDWIPVPLPAKIRALASPDIELISMGGATEASIWSILYPIGEVPETWTSIPYGRAMVNQTFHVLDGDLEPRPVWVPGALYIGGIGVALGYWRDPERTAERFLVHPRTGERLYRTGDLGRYLPSGEIEFLGREDFQVKVHGYRIELGEIEAALLAHPGVDKAVADARGERGARRLCAWWVPIAGVAVPDETVPDEEALRAFLAERLPEYMVPAALLQLPSLPLSSNGKVDRQALPEPTRGASAATGEASELAQRIGAVAAKVLEVEAIDLDADLFEVGASSLHMIRIANLVEHELGLRLRIEDFYRAPTVAGLAALRGDAVVPPTPSAAGAADRRQGDRWQQGRSLEPSEVERFKHDWRQQQAAARAERGVAVALPPAPPTRLDAELAPARRSRRHFAAEPLAAETLSRWLACLAQRQRDGQGTQLYPSAGGIYPIEVYVHVRPGRVEGIEGGIYAYDGVEHGLRRLSGADLDAGIHDPFVNRPIYEQAAFGLFLVAQARAIVPVYGASARDFCLLEAGYMGQLLMLQAPECGIGVCPVGGLDFERVREHFDLDAGHECVHSLLGGGLSDQPEPAALLPQEPEPKLVAVPRDGLLPLSFSQQRMWLAHRLEPDNPAYNTALVLRLRGRFDARAFERALRHVLARHEILRTSYVEVEGRPWQRIEPLGPWVLPRLDLRGLPPERGAQLVQSLAQAATRRPVDLTTAPLLRALSLRLAEDDHALLLALHHIVGDAWSTGILAHELRLLYAALTAGRQLPELPELAVQYADFAVWQQRWLDSAAMARELEYWHQRLAGVEPLALPTDRARGQVATHHGARHVVRLAPEQSARFEAVARRGAATHFAQYLGAVTVLLAWLCEQDDIVVGSPATHRDSLATEPLIGFFVNTLALRTDVSGDPTFEQLLGRVQETVRGAWEHRRVPFEKVLEGVGRDAEARDAPLFRVWFVLHEEPPPGFELPGVETEVQEVATAAARYDLKLELWGQPQGGFRCDIEYRTELFEAATLERLERALLWLLAEVEPDAPLSTLRERLSAAEQSRRTERGESFRGARLQGLRQLRRPRRKVDPEAPS